MGHQEDAEHRITFLPSSGRVLKDSFTLLHLYVSVDRQMGEFIHSAARPANLHAVNFRRSAGTKNLARIMRGEITPAIGFQTTPLDPTGLPRDYCANCGRVAPGCDQLQTEPVVPVAAFVTKE